MTKLSEKKPLFDLETAYDYLIDQNISLRFNELTREIELEGFGDEYKADPLNSFFTLTYDLVRQTHITSRAHCDDLFRAIATRNAYNPVAAALDKTVLDDKNRLDELYNLLNISEDDKLSRTLIHKWALQAIALAYNNLQNPSSADGVLVLLGRQGVGKTSTVKALGGNFCKLGVTIDPKNKDTLIQGTTAWICELAELESTLRGDLQMLKAFITAECDEIRRPYDRFPIKTPRRTVFIGTVNSTDFLIDPSGNRRFWTIPLEKVDLEGLRKFDTMRFWKQMEFEYADEIIKKNADVCFRLTPEERDQLAERNGAHEKPLAGQREIEDIIYPSVGDDGKTWTYCTVSAFIEDNPQLKRYSAEQVGKALDKCSCPTYRRRINGTPMRVRFLPLSKYSATVWVKSSESVNSVHSA